MPFRLTMFFLTRKSGWTENFYSNAVDHAAALTDLKALSNVRKELLGRQGLLEFLRVSDVNAVRDALVYANFGDEARSLTAAANQQDSDDPSEGVLYRFQVDHSRWRSSYVRGIWDNLVTQGADPTAAYPIGWNAKYAAWKAVMINGKYALKNKDQTQPKARVLTVAPWGAVLSRSLITTFAAHGFIAGDRVQILMKKPGTLKRYLKQWEVLSVPDGSSFVIEAVAPTVGIAPTNMFAQKVIYAYQSITDVIFERYGKRKCGRPFGVPRGRLANRPPALAA